MIYECSGKCHIVTFPCFYFVPDVAKVLYTSLSFNVFTASFAPKVSLGKSLKQCCRLMHNSPFSRPYMV